ncbi:hypothetical protein WR25_12209 [Diploscapter pachys]|uniref:Apple domain-containing protein n=1 Tax=Diploscapter pachys TaxID=2018661 RepID=A0A2A2LWP4_9BILA|nr:hypothetical protein WR25_12209 [Diploscapter pachys]
MIQIRRTDSGDRTFDPFGAYDDNNIVATENEKSLFVPKPYRPESKKPETKPPTTPPPPPTTIRTIPFIQTTRAPVFRPQQPIQPIQPQRPFIPQQTFTRQPLPHQPQLAFRPQVPQVPFTQAPAQPRTQQFTHAPVQPITQQFTQQFTRRPFFPQQTAAPFVPVTQAPPQLPPQPRPAIARPSSLVSQPRLPFANTNNLRNGQCHASIFYISTPISGPTRLTFTHFAIAVTVDQCARTCHEFNCAIAHYNPINGHCEFNPSTAFAIRNGQCPAWPSLHYRNNVVASEPVRIFCVTCQRPRRRPGRAGRRRSKSSRHVRSKKPSSAHPIIHGVLVKQPVAVALSLSQNRYSSADEDGVDEPQREIPVSIVDAEQDDNSSEMSSREFAKIRSDNQKASKRKQLRILDQIEDLEN